MLVTEHNCKYISSVFKVIAAFQKCLYLQQVDAGVEIIDGPHTQAVTGSLSTVISALIPGVT